MRACLDMHGDDVGAGFGEGFEIRIARRDHQMHVERLLGVRPDRFDDIRPDRNVGHEMAVHDVDMDPVGAGGIDRAHLFAEFCEIGGEDRRGDDERARTGFAVRLTRHSGAGNARRCGRQELPARRRQPADSDRGPARVAARKLQLLSMTLAGGPGLASRGEPAASAPRSLVMSLSVNSSNTQNPFAHCNPCCSRAPRRAVRRRGPIRCPNCWRPSSSKSAALPSSAERRDVVRHRRRGRIGQHAPPFGPQTLQALFAMQANDAQSLMSQFDGATSSTESRSGARRTSQQPPAAVRARGACSPRKPERARPSPIATARRTTPSPMPTARTSR